MDVDVTNAAGRSRYELVIDGEVVGIADYRIEGPRIVFPHTEITPRLRGRGLGDVLVRGALDDVRGTGRQVVPRCWFVDQFIDDHPEYADLRETSPSQAFPGGP